MQSAVWCSHCLCQSKKASCCPAWRRSSLVCCRWLGRASILPLKKRNNSSSNNNRSSSVALLLPIRIWQMLARALELELPPLPNSLCLYIKILPCLLPEESERHPLPQALIGLNILFLHLFLSIMALLICRLYPLLLLILVLQALSSIHMLNMLLLKLNRFLLLLLLHTSFELRAGKSQFFHSLSRMLDMDMFLLKMQLIMMKSSSHLSIRQILVRPLQPTDLLFHGSVRSNDIHSSCA